jgi:hypothetical protein
VAAAGGVTVIGDSVTVDATPSLEAAIPNVTVNADVGRQVDTGVGIAQGLASAGRLGGALVVALGTNGTFSQSSFAELVSLTAGKRLVIVTAHCGHCGWIQSNNSMIESSCNASTHCTVADWYTLAENNPSWFVDAPDDIHMPVGGAGAQAFAALVAQALSG